MRNHPSSHRTGTTVNALNTRAILEASLEDRELSPVEALHLLCLDKPEELAALREAADALRERQVGDEVLYTTGTSLFLTNLCEMAPALYPYPKTPGQDHIRTLTIDDLDACLELAAHRRLEQLYVSGGGFWPYLQVPGLEAPNILKTCANVLGYVHERMPQLAVQGFSPDEVDFLCIVSDRDAHYVLELLRDHGLQTLGGNGAEILVDTVRQTISPRKATVKRWFEIAATAHTLDMPVMARLEAGPLETLPQRVAHLEAIRAFLKRHPGAFSAWVPHMWTRQPAQPGLTLAAPPHGSPSDRFKLVAVARLFLGTMLPTQQVFRPLGNKGTDALEESQEGLQWGANHFGGTDALAYPAFLAGSREPNLLSEADLQRLIAETGRPTRSADTDQAPQP
jgi:FO synthase subunit 2